MNVMHFAAWCCSVRGVQRQAGMTPMTLTLLIGASLAVSCQALKCYDCYSRSTPDICSDKHLNTTSMSKCSDAKKYCYKLMWPCPRVKGHWRLFWWFVWLSSVLIKLIVWHCVLGAWRWKQFICEVSNFLARWKKLGCAPLFTIALYESLQRWLACRFYTILLT